MLLPRKAQFLCRTVKSSVSLVNSVSSRSCQLCSKAGATSNFTVPPINQDHLVQELVSSLDCPLSTAKRIVAIHPEIRKIDFQVLKENIITLKALGYRKESVCNFPEVLSLKPTVLYHRAQILEESQLLKSVRLLYNLKGNINLRISLLKAYRLISDDADVINGLLSRVGNLPALKSTELTERQSLSDLYITIMKEYVKKRLNIENESDAAVIKKSTLKELSIRQLKRNISFLLNVAGFSKEKVLENFKYVRRINPAKLLALMNLFKSKDCDIRKHWRARPKMLILNYEKVLHALSLLEEFDVPFAAALHNPGVFTIPTAVMRRNLQLINSIRDFNIFKFHPRFLELVIKPDFALKQLDQYKRQDFNKVSLSLLIDGLPKKLPSFQDTSKYGRMDLLLFISTKLGRSKDEIREQLSLHPYWTTIPLLQVEETMTFLLNNHFSKEEILGALQLVLYPRVRVELEMLILNKRDFKECRSSITFGRQPVPVKKEYVLQLLLYFIEKGTNFSGDGVWLDNTFRHLNDSDYEDEEEEDATGDPDYFKNQNRVMSLSENNSIKAESLP